MALETLKNLETIGTTALSHIVDGVASAASVITVNHDTNEITFKIQKGPVKEAGKNGCQIDDIVAVAKTIVAGLNTVHPCPENGMVLAGLEIAQMALNMRTANRTTAGTEGTML